MNIFIPPKRAASAGTLDVGLVIVAATVVAFLICGIAGVVVAFDRHTTYADRL